MNISSQQCNIDLNFFISEKNVIELIYLKKKRSFSIQVNMSKMPTKNLLC